MNEQQKSPFATGDLIEQISSAVDELNNVLQAAHSLGLKVWVHSSSMILNDEAPKVSVSVFREERLL